MAHASPMPSKNAELPVTPVTISARGEKAIRFASTVAVLSVFIAALILSWNGLTQLAINAGFNESIAWLMPIAIDGMVVAGGLNVLHASLTRQSTKFGWFLTILGAGLSIWGNIAAFGDSHFTAEAVVHGIAPAAMALALEALLRILRGRIHATQAELERQQEEEEARAVEAEKRRVAEEKRLEKERRAQEKQQAQVAAPKRTVVPTSRPSEKVEKAVSKPAQPTVPAQVEEETSTTHATVTKSPTALPAITEGSKQEQQEEVARPQTENAATAPQQTTAAKTHEAVDSTESSVPVTPSSTPPEDALVVDFDSDDPLGEMVKIVDSLPADTTDTDKVLAIIESFPKPSSADLALALGKGESDADKRSAYKALERARAKQKKLATAQA